MHQFVTAIALAMLGIVSPTWATIWSGGTGNYNTSANWNSGAGPVPGSGDFVIIGDTTFPSNADVTINTTANASYIDIGANPSVGSNNKVTISNGGNLTVANEIFLSESGNQTGNQIIQNGGSVVAYDLQVGRNSGSSTGTYTLSGNGSYTGAISLGQATGTTGTWIQNGGTALFNNYGFRIGENGTGNLTLNSGTITSTALSIIGNGGTAIGTITQTGGLFTQQGYLIVGNNGTGTYNLQGGKLVVDNLKRQTAGSALNLTGGTLALNTQIEWNGLTLQNNGSTLAPKDIGTVGTVNFYDTPYFQSSLGSLAIDIASIGSFDYLHLYNGRTATLGGTVNVNFLSGYTPTIGNTFDVLLAEGGVTLNSLTAPGFATSVINNPSYGAGGNTLRLTYNGIYPAAAVPEPTVVLLFGFGGLIIYRRMRRRKGSARN